MQSKIWIKLMVVFLIQIKIIAMEPTWYETNNGKRFLIDTEEKYNWYQAWNECARYDAQLIAIDSEEKNRVLMKLLTNVNEKVKNLWIGGNVLYNKIFFYWADNEQEFSFTNWATDDMDKLAFKKQCVYLMRQRKNIPWNFGNCDDKKYGFICEELIKADEFANSEVVKSIGYLNGSMYNGSIYGLVG